MFTNSTISHYTEKFSTDQYSKALIPYFLCHQLLKPCLACLVMFSHHWIWPFDFHHGGCLNHRGLCVQALFQSAGQLMSVSRCWLRFALRYSGCCRCWCQKPQHLPFQLPSLSLSLSRLIASLNSGKEFREAVGSTRCVEYKAGDYIRVRKERVRSEHKTFCEAGKVFYGRKINPWQYSFSKEEVILTLKRKKQNRYLWSAQSTIMALLWLPLACLFGEDKKAPRNNIFLD